MIYFFDGSKEAFLTAFLLAYRDGEALLTAGEKQLSIGQKSVFVRADPAMAAKCERRLLELDKRCMDDLSFLLRSGEGMRGQTAFLYLRLIAQRGRPVRGELAEDAVSEATECIRRIKLEAHRLKGFVRFLECASGALYAPVSPVNDVCDLLLPHFRGRLGHIPFVLHDVPRGKAAVWDGAHAFLAPLQHAEIVLSSDEAGWQALWRRYYNAVTLPSRARLKQMKGYMPVRYWKFLPEDPAAAIGDLPAADASANAGGASANAECAAGRALHAPSDAPSDTLPVKGRAPSPQAARDALPPPHGSPRPPAAPAHP